MMEDKNKGILLESGTNELEIVEFGICGETYGINVMKVREIIEPVAITKVPNSHIHMLGIIQMRGEVMPVIDLEASLGMSGKYDGKESKFIVAELNKMKVVFKVHTVSRIHRISWEQIEKPSEAYQTDAGVVIGIIKLNERMMLLLDFEKILVDINPQSGISVERVKKLGTRERSNKKILIAEDSTILRRLLQETLNEAGYEKLEFHTNGKLAWEHLEKLAKERGEKVTEDIQLIITDIEMPQMDGLHLTKRIKENEALKKLPVIIFSSLISDDLKHKGEQVGANAQISKPEIDILVQEMDKHIL